LWPFGQWRFALKCVINFVEIKDSTDLEKCSHIVLPGVGSFNEVINTLKKRELFSSLIEHIKYKKKNFLGICVGMQILSTFGYENIKCEGLNLIEGITDQLRLSYKKVPNMGWHEIIKKKNSVLFNNIEEKECFYFLHSYYFLPKNEGLITSEIKYEKNIPASVEYENIFGVQFHPEKSQHAGIQLLKNFANI
jgi:glutamine amidotransferase